MTGPARPASSGFPVGRWVWAAVALVTFGLGMWGELVPAQATHVTVPDAAYRAARLFTLNLDYDPLPGRAGPPPQLWIAAVLAPVLLVAGVAELFEQQLHGVVVRYVIGPRFVVFGGDHRAAAIVRAEGIGWGRRITRRIVVADTDADRRATARMLGAWTVTGDGLDPRSLRRAGVHRTPTVVVATGDDRRNAAIAAQLQGFVGAAGRTVFVEVDDPGLARALERPTSARAVLGDTQDDDRQVPFSGLTLAAGYVMDLLDRSDGPLLAGDPAGRVAPTLALFGEGPLVDAFALNLRRQRRMQLLRTGDRCPPRPRLVVVGPDAEQRCAGLRALLGAELDLLDVIAVDDVLGQALTLRADTARALLGHRLARVLVLAPDDLAGGPIALTLAQHLGRRGRLALVTVGPASPFGDRVVRRTRGDPTRADVRIFRVPEQAYRLARIEDHRGSHRLARALYQAGGGTGWWPELAAAEREPWFAETVRFRSTIDLMLRGNAFMAFSPPEEQVLRALGDDAQYAALAVAGLSPDLHDPAQLARIAERLQDGDSGDDRALPVWCEVARRSTDAEVLARLERRPMRLSPESRRVLRLRRAQIERAEADAAEDDAPGGDPRHDTILVIGGSAVDASSAVREVLETTLGRPPFPGVVVGPGVGNGVGRVLDDLAGRLRLRALPEDAAAARGVGLDLLERQIRGGAGTLRVLGLPGAPSVWLHLAVLRTLRARIGWLLVHAPGEQLPDLDRALLGGRAGIVDLPVDPATVRAFLRPSRWTGGDAERERLATAVHDAYLVRRATDLVPTDPARRPFPQLPPALQDSNRAVVDDLPAKLAFVDRPDALATAAWPDGWPDAAVLEQLAELEHGRWNAERLLAGWEGGARDTARFVSPHLRPWCELDDVQRQWDRDTVTDVLTALRALRRGP